ncbi:MAG: 3-hydroxyanthranilate 3,4-dioxygenase [Rhodospirillaceae bacterium]|nr:3-hydroxyanthranilate 3,4-dioxygenase [Rhodospirillaceae bacterium]MDD9924232.1 3-hydroxyanthranilate 3,4-dioxygenase [Rhodospirillaceae bacterium]
MTLPLPLNLAEWIDTHRDQLKPPVGAKTIWTDADFIVTVVGGPNDRPDYHDDPYEEIFYQLQGDMTLKIFDDGVRRDLPIREGEIFLLPPHVLHSPQRPADTIGLIVERTRPAGVIDGFEWFCDACGARVHRAEVQVAGLEQGVNDILAAYDTDATLRTCDACGHVNPGRGARA